MNITTKLFEWPHRFAIGFDDRIRFPNVGTKAPGIYRLDMGGEIYVGMAFEKNGLNGRWKHYTRFRTDKDPVKFTNNRIHTALLPAAKASQAFVSWLTAHDEIVHNGTKLDLWNKARITALEGYLVLSEGATLNL